MTLAEVEIAFLFPTILIYLTLCRVHDTCDGNHSGHLQEWRLQLLLHLGSLMSFLQAATRGDILLCPEQKQEAQPPDQHAIISGAASMGDIQDFSKNASPILLGSTSEEPASLDWQVREQSSWQMAVLNP